MWLNEMLQDSMIAHDPYAFAWFWKAQLVGYQCRLNNRTRDFIRRAMSDSEIPVELWRPNGFDIAMHVRHSDLRESRLVNDSEYASVLSLARRLIGRDPIVFLATDDENSLQFFQSLPGMKVYAFRGIEREKWKDDISRGRAGDISTLWALADIEMIAQASIVVGSHLSNLVRVAMELGATRYGLASRLFMEVGELECVSMAHCDYLKIPWKFDFMMSIKRNWGSFDTGYFQRKKTGENLTQAFYAKFRGIDPVPTSI
jgi:hypothetical protein